MKIERGQKLRINALCTNCEACVSLCPTQSIFLGSKHFVIDRDTCDGHGICAGVCAVHAIEFAPPEEHKVNDDEAVLVAAKKSEKSG